MAKKEKAKKPVVKKAKPRPPAGLTLSIQVIQNGIVQVENAFPVNSMFKKNVRMGSHPNCELHIPFCSIIDSVPLFVVGAGKASVRIDPRFKGYLSTGTQFAKLEEFLNPRGALAETVTVGEPLNLEIKNGARGTLQIHGFEVLFKVFRPKPVTSPNAFYDVGRAPFALPHYNSRLEPSAIPIALLATLFMTIPLLVWLLHTPIQGVRSIGDLNDELLMELIHPIHYRYSPAIYADKFDPLRANKQIVHWVSEFQKRMESADEGLAHRSSIPLIATPALPSKVSFLPSDWNSVLSEKFEELAKRQREPSSARHFHFQKPNVQLVTATSGDALGSLPSRQQRRVAEIEKAYGAVRSLMYTEHAYLKRFYKREDVKVGKLLSIPKTGRFLGAQPSPEFDTERANFIFGERKAQEAEKTKTRPRLAQMGESDERSGDVVLEPASLVVPLFAEDKLDRGTSSKENLWANAALAMNPSLVPPLPTPKPAVDMHEVAMLVFSKREQIKSCYDSALRRNENLNGTLILEWKINLSGRAEAIQKAKATFQDPLLVECLRSRILTWRFPKPVHGAVTVTYPFQFEVSQDSRAIR